MIQQKQNKMFRNNFIKLNDKHKYKVNDDLKEETVKIFSKITVVSLKCSLNSPIGLK